MEKRISNLIFVDVETTGLEAGKHKIIEIGAILVGPQNLEILEEFNEKILWDDRVMLSASPEALKINGYDRDLWIRDAKFEEDVLTGLNKFTGGALMVGWNIGFDRAFLEAAYRRYGKWFPFDYHAIDVMSLTWWEIGYALDSLSLSKVCKYLGIEPEPEVHRALNGARKCYEVFSYLVRRRSLNRFMTL